MLNLILASLAMYQNQVEVWDSVFDTQTCTKLHNYTSHHGLSHKIFHRNSCCATNTPADTDKNEQSGVTMLEQAIDSALTELGDDAKIVEYWCRQEWKKIEAHSDVDEHLAIEEQVYRHPRNGHVLYLQVGSEVRGPTCLFLGCKFGGDLVKEDNNNIELITIPAVEGRLLRFEGSLLHAVPRPADLWLLPFTGVGPTGPEHIWGRSVVLFNTWPDAPPRGIKTDKSKSDLTLTNKNEINENISNIQCEPAFSWKSIPLIEMESSNNDDEQKSLSKCKIWLLGDGPRRDYPGRTINLKAPFGLKDVLENTREPIVSRLES